MRDRYLFSADRKPTEYRTVLEITRGHARLIRPSAAARVLWWLLALVYVAIYTGIVGALWIALALNSPGSLLVGWPIELLTMVVWLVGLIAAIGLADRRSLPLLADSPAEKTELILMGARSFGTYQEVRARTLTGEEMKLVVDGRAPRFWEAVGLLEGKAPAAG